MMEEDSHSAPEEPEKENAESETGAPKNLIEKAKDAVVDKLDQNGNGVLEIEDLILLCMKMPGIKIDRADFLRKELFKDFSPAVIEDAVEFTPAHAGISAEAIDKIADEVIKYERNCVSGISAALGLPGGWAMAATIPADIAQYFGYTLRATQKLLYLYGFPELHTEEEGLRFDSEIMNTITLCLGVMYGVAGANNAIKAMAKALATGVEKKILQAALTKGAIYPIVRNVMKWFGINLTKNVISGFFKKAIPVVGGVIGGGITYLTFKPCCDNLKKVLQDTKLSNPDHVDTAEETDIANKVFSGEVIDVLDYELVEDEETERLKEADHSQPAEISDK